MQRLLLARHAESAYSALALVNGDPSVAVGLSEQGRDEARALGEALAGEEIDLVVVTPFPRTHETADLALAGRSLPRIVSPELRDPGYGAFEGGPLEAYRSWAEQHSSADAPPGGGEARAVIVRRYAAGLRALLGRPEGIVLAVLHSLPIAYVLLALEGQEPRPRVPLVEYARPYPLGPGELEQAVGVLERWLDEPTW